MHNTAQQPSIHPIHRRVPRAGLDIIDDADAAFSLVAGAIHCPRRHETIVLVLDDSRRGVAIVVVAGTEEPDAVVGVVEFLTNSIDERAGALVVTSVRPGGDERSSNEDARERERDIDRWLDMSEIASLAGVEMLEWFVVDDVARCPRDDLGEAPRW